MCTIVVHQLSCCSYSPVFCICSDVSSMVHLRSCWVNTNKLTRVWWKAVVWQKHLHISVSDPFPPETPQNARTRNQTVHSDGTVSVLVLWEAPRESDLVVHHYKVTWNTRGTPPTSQSRAGRVTDGVSPPELSPLSHPSAGMFSQILCILLYLC